MIDAIITKQIKNHMSKITKSAMYSWKTLSLTNYEFENYDILEYRLSEHSDYNYVLVQDVLKYVRIFDQKKGPFIWKVSFNILRRQGKVYLLEEDAEIEFANRIPIINVEIPITPAIPTIIVQENQPIHRRENHRNQNDITEYLKLNINEVKIVDQPTFKFVIPTLHTKHKGCFKSKEVANKEYLIVKVKEVD